MREFVIPTSKPKLRLLDAAEQLVAGKGFDAVSVRDVTELAKANVAAVNYHFGSREGMMGLVIGRRMMTIQQERLDRLAVLEKKWGNKGIPLEELVDAWVRPLVSVSGSERMVARILALPAEALPEPVDVLSCELWARFLKAFGKALSSVPKEDLAWRLHFLNGAVIQLLSGSESLMHWTQGASAVPEKELSLSHFLRFALAAIREGGVEDKPTAKRGPQATFDF